MRLANEMLHNNGHGYTGCNNAQECSWGQVRVADFMITMQWMLENHPSDEDQILWASMAMLQDLSQFKWEEWYEDGVYQKIVTEPSPDNPMFPFLHGVNVGQVLHRFMHNDTLLQSAKNAVEGTFKYYGSPSGSVLADEIMRDNKPWMGSELCTAVETGFSLSYLYQATGENLYADMAERTYFNALPVQTSGDSWGHQYMDQPNQPFATYDHRWADAKLFTTANSGMATVCLLSPPDGLEPVYPCCTVNFPQGLPKSLTRSWATAGSDGIAHMLLGPSRVTTNIDGKAVTIHSVTNYPFHHTLNYDIQADVGFVLHVRIPQWHIQADSTVRINDGAPNPLHSDPFTGMHQIPIQPGRTQINITIGAEPRVEWRKPTAVSVYIGNLLYALDVGSTNSTTQPHPYGTAGGPGMNYLPFPQARDFYYANTMAWNVAIDPATLVYRGLDPPDLVLDDLVFSYYGAVTSIEVQGCEIEWPLLAGLTPGEVPESPKCTSERRTFVLKPYGALKVHMSELPIVHFGAGA
ncbi:Uu.00g013800.m01.CDS01 [Anthostomella pinea]|uniref:Uu.00g013800.m01.CDS01 n=1 Tax=Anthostomella pinea TaxID=933095 RepID=A0AAI8VY78_9PEZI|nr:Uu.00g013800.m01.CDS01 [Anthostomella pinea]